MEKGWLAVVLVSGCAVWIDTESTGPSGEVVSDCVVDGVPGAPESIELPEGSLWLWEASSALVRPGEDPCAGLALGPALVPLLPEEVASNEARTDGRTTAVAPRGGFFADGLIHLYFDVVLRGPGFFDAEILGTGVCTTADPATPCVRDGSLLFVGPGGWPVHGVPGDDGYVYLLGCTHVAAFEDLCGTARVPPDAAADPEAYRYWSWAQGWIEEARQFTVAFEHAGAISPAWDPVRREYTLVTADVWTSTLSLRTSDRPWEGWSSPAPLVQVEPPPDWFIGGGVEHSALRGEEGRRFVISYANPAVHVMTVRVDR